MKKKKILGKDSKINLKKSTFLDSGERVLPRINQKIYNVSIIKLKKKMVKSKGGGVSQSG